MHEPVTLGARIATLLATTLPLVGLVAAIIMLWGVGFDWVHLVILVVMYIATGIGITVGYHRLFTHRSFETSAPVKFILAALGSMAFEGAVIRWVAVHRAHHQHSDRDLDPHSPHLHGAGFWATLRGLWHAHMGWFFKPDLKNLKKYVPDLYKERVIRVSDRLFPMWAAVGLLLPAAVAGLVTWSWLGALLGFIWGGLVRVFLVHHVTWSVNSICHVWGSQPFASHDHSRNNALLGILAFGEGWHNNHHAFPASARHGLKWWQIDTSWMIIRGMEIVGLARTVRVPSREHVERKQAARR